MSLTTSLTVRVVWCPASMLPPLIWDLIGFNLTAYNLFIGGFKHPLPRSSTPNCHWPHGWDFAGERARPRAQQRGKTARHRIGECVLPSGHCCGRGRPRSARVRPTQSARGLAHSKTLRAVRASSVNAPAFWSAVALHRFFITHETCTQFQTPIAPFVHPKPPLAARLGLCRGARPSRWLFSASRLRAGAFFAMAKRLFHLEMPRFHLPTELFQMAKEFFHLEMELFHLPTAHFHLEMHHFHLPAERFHLEKPHCQGRKPPVRQQNGWVCLRMRQKQG